MIDKNGELPGVSSLGTGVPSLRDWSSNPLELEFHPYGTEVSPTRDYLACPEDGPMVGMEVVVFG